jgi:cytochrome c-type biogenesis protein
MDMSHGLTLSALSFSLFMGLVSFVSPCILPLIPSYVSYITGISFDELADRDARKRTMRRALLHSFAFVGGFTIVFVMLGATASMAGAALVKHLNSLRIVGGLLIIVMGALVTGLVKVPFLQRDMKLRLKKRPAGYAGTVLVGMVFSAGWTPCTGPFLGSVLALAMETETVNRGMALLTCYSLGLGIPFILSAAALGAFLASFNKLKKYVRAVRMTSGVVLIIMGLLLITDKMTLLIIR